MSDAPNTQFLSLPAIKVRQPLGDFYLACFKARDLKKITYVTELSVSGNDGKTYDLAGGQRQGQESRRDEVANFIRTSEAAFPNSIILGANFDTDGRLVEQDAIRWRVIESDTACLQLIIPTEQRIAAVIDGQHRLMGFDDLTDEFGDFELPCSVYLDLPTPYQAYVFAVINFNQKKVDKSLAYEMFAFDANAKSPDTWSPETLAVHLCRRLNLEAESPFHKHIRIAPQSDKLIFEESEERHDDWTVSTATVVEGILRLVTSNAKQDKNSMHRQSVLGQRNRRAVGRPGDRSPLRELFKKVNDVAIYTAVVNFFTVASQTLWSTAKPNSFIVKTVGIQALFDIMKHSLADFNTEQDIRKEKFESLLRPAGHIDFSDVFFQPSGVGRTRIKNCILFCAKAISEEDLKPDDLSNYRRLREVPAKD